MGFYQASRDGRLLWANAAFARLLGFDNWEQARNHEWASEDAPSYKRRDVRTRIEEAGEVRGAESTWRRADGAVIVVREHARLIQNARGEALYIEATVEDVTERRKTEDGLRLLAESSVLFANPGDPNTILASLAQLAVPTLGDWCTVHMLKWDGTLRLVAVAHVDPTKVEVAQELQRRYPPAPEANLGPSHVVETGQPQLVEHVPESLWEVEARDPEHLQLLREQGIRSFLCIPLRARDQIQGAITFAWSESGHRYGPADQAMAEALAQRAALAIDNARLVQAERVERVEAEESERRAQFLAEASRVFASSLELDARLGHLARLSVPIMGDWCVVHIVDAGGAIHQAAAAHLDPAKTDVLAEIGSRFPAPPDADHGYPHVIRTGEPEWHKAIHPDALEGLARDRDHARLLREVGCVSQLCVPLSARGRVLGAITFASAREDRRFDPLDVQLAQDLAARAALSMDNARLFQDERNARTDAEAALKQLREAEARLQVLNAQLEQRVRTRTAELAASNKELEAFAHAIAHDLHGPLRSIDGFSLALEQTYGSSLDDRGRQLLARVRAAGQRMSHAVQDLLHLTQVVRSTLQPERVDLVAIARSVAAQFQRREPERRVEVVLPASAAAQADPQLLRTLLEHLLGNAWKFTRGRDVARVELGVESRGDEEVFFVRDNGVGFDPAHAHKLFTPFQRLHGALEFEGSGIGLAIVQRIVQRHGGRAWASGNVGEGATIFFTLRGPA